MRCHHFTSTKLIFDNSKYMYELCLWNTAVLSLSSYWLSLLTFLFCLWLTSPGNWWTTFFDWLKQGCDSNKTVCNSRRVLEIGILATCPFDSVLNAALDLFSLSLTLVCDLAPETGGQPFRQQLKFSSFASIGSKVDSHSGPVTQGNSSVWLWSPSHRLAVSSQSVWHEWTPLALTWPKTGECSLTPTFRLQSMIFILGQSSTTRMTSILSVYFYY